MNHIELFAGIGGFRQALTLLEHDFGIEEKTVAFSEIDESAVKTYKASFDTSGEVEMGDIVAFNQNKNNIFKLPDFNFLTGGFPCQAFSMMGKQKGFSQLDLSLAIGYKSVSLVAGAEAGYKNIHFNLEHLFRISKALDIDIREFFEL